jgi:hypothetical protein
LVALWNQRDKRDRTIKNLRSLDPQRVEQAVSTFMLEAPSFQPDYDAYVNVFKVAGENYRTFMKAFAVYQLALGVIGGAMSLSGGSGGLIAAESTVTGVSATGQATMGIAIQIEWAEAIRRLIQIGAITTAVAGQAVIVSAYPGQGLGSMRPTLMLRATPSGSVTPSKGADSGKAASYGDTRNKHTKLADHDLAELEDAVKNPGSATGDLKNLKPNIGDPKYGSQLSKQAADKYADLVKDALENGKRVSPSQIDHTASFEVGIDIISGNATRNYRMFYSAAYGGWHIFPI